MEEDILRVYSNANIELIKGSNGVFEIWLNEELIYTKADKYRFPRPNESVILIKQALAQ